jgi:hypothetical protein
MRHHSLMIFLIILCSAATAQAQTRTAVAGKPLKLYAAYSANPDCSSAGEVVVRVTQSPRYGRVAIARTGVFPNFPASNSRSACNRRRVPGTVATYVAQRGYTGRDSVSLEVIYPTGQHRQAGYDIAVR